MPDEIEMNLAPEEKLVKAQGHLNAVVLGMLAYLKEQGLAFDECMAFLGAGMAKGWSPKLTAIEFLKREAAFLDAIGCSLHGLRGDANQAEAMLRSWPPDADWTTAGFLSLWKLNQEEVDLIWEMYRPIAERLGLDYQWQRDGDQVTLTLRGRAASPTN
jgi:hypothetical protein